jgi:hypothetical protein
MSASSTLSSNRRIDTDRFAAGHAGRYRAKKSLAHLVG